MKSFNKFLQEKGLWDNIHAKRKRGEKMRKPGEEGAPTDADFKRSQAKESVEEKTLTPAEKKKREEIARAMERENPGMDMKKKMAIATWQAKKVAESSDYAKRRKAADDEYYGKKKPKPATKTVAKTDYQKRREVNEAEETLDESISKMSHARLKFHATKGVPHGSYSNAEIKDEHERRMRTEPNYVKAKASMNEEAELDEAVEVSHDRYMRSHGKKASGGEGNWMFTHKRMGDADVNDSKEVHSARGKFSDAKKSAQQWAKKHGHSTVYVMEEVEELDEISRDLATRAAQGFADKADKAHAKKDYAGFKKGEAGRKLAIAKVQGRAKVSAVARRVEEVELDEVSSSTLGSYISKADANKQEKDRAKGIDLAVRKKHPSLAAYMKKSAKVNATEEVNIEEGLYHVEYGRAGKLTHQVVATDANDAHKKAMAHLKKKNPKLAHPDYADTFKKPSITRIKGNEPRADNYKTEEVELDEAEGTAAKYAGKSGIFGGKYTSTDRMMNMKNFNKIRDKRAKQRDDEHQKQDPKHAAAGYAKHMVDTDKAKKKAAKRGVDASHLNYRHTNGLKQESTQIDEISRDLARRYIRKVADKTNTGELSTKEVEKRRPGVNLAGKKAYPGIAGKAKVSATEENEPCTDKKPEKYMKPDGTVGIRLMRTNKRN